ncbi:uncharacterized protein LOC111357322 [Spodoptera litura]|uniref:Uncharacterized protein LOC111357322 n=1 Tax=Spodoptera litura TaxID=69820 RepID=A0A9J7EFU1_SPOLT|nr:uncharacterized protein LOC111357322 [Spodoptera litura]
MHYHSASELLFCILLIHCIQVNSTTKQLDIRHPNGNIFNVLLGLYKVNPLKSSKVYKAFSEDMLLGRGDKTHIVLNFESDEYAKEQMKTNLHEIEKIIHKKSEKPRNHLEKPEYDINDVSTENFKVDIVLNDKILAKEQLKKSYQDKEEFGSLFGHIGSNEIFDNALPVTKLLPMNRIKFQSRHVSKPKFNEFELIRDDGKFSMPTSTMLEVRDKNQEDSPADLRLDKVPDVVVI